VECQFLIEKPKAKVTGRQKPKNCCISAHMFTYRQRQWLSCGLQTGPNPLFSLGNWMDGHVSCWHSVPTSFLVWYVLAVTDRLILVKLCIWRVMSWLKLRIFQTWKIRDFHHASSRMLHRIFCHFWRQMQQKKDTLTGCLEVGFVACYFVKILYTCLNILHFQFEWWMCRPVSTVS